MSKRPDAAGATPATVALLAAGVAFTPHAYAHDPGTTNYGLEAASALGLDPQQVFKTLLADVDGALVVAIVPVTGKLDLKALAAAVGGKRAEMADPRLAERRTGYIVGGISPIGQKTRHTTVLDLDPGQVFKTLLADVDGRVVVGIVPVSGKLDLKALAAAVGGKKAEMADPKLAERRTGYVVGGISPIGQKISHATVLDETAELYDTVFVSGGKRGFDIELAPADLLAVTGGSTAAIARD